MLLTIFNVVYVLVAIGMSVMILLQRGAGAAAGSGFGGGASGTVFGARGAATFLSRSTGVLAGLFFLLSLAMGIYLGNTGTSRPADDLGIMGGVETTAPKTPEAPAGADVPKPAGAVGNADAAGASDTPAPAPAAASDQPPPAAASDKPAPAPASDKPAPPPLAKAQKKAGDKPKPADPEKH